MVTKKRLHTFVPQSKVYPVTSSNHQRKVIGMINRVIRLPEVLARTGLGRSTIYKLMSENNFPKVVKMTKRTSVWISDEVDQWIDSRIKLRLESEENIH